VATAENPKSSRKGPLEVFLSLFADIQPGEGTTALLLTLDVFLLLTSYYLLKVAREPLILTGGGAEIKSYASLGQSILLIPAVATYDWLAGKVGRMALSFWVTSFFIGCLILFFILSQAGLPLGIPFFLWVGIFNVSAVAQFWSFAADIYSEQEGKRIFPVIGIGSSIGAVAGAWIAESLIKLGPYMLMLIAAGILGLSLGVTFLVHTRERASAKARSGGKDEAKEAPIGGESGYKLLFKDNYLLLFAALILILNIITKTGDYVLDTKLLAAAHEAGGNAQQYIGEYKAHYFKWVNGIGVVVQLFVVSRIIKYLGMRGALVIMPIVSLLGYGATFVAPVLGVIFWARVAESSLDYSLSNTTRQTLWLVTSREVKYKTKQVIDSFVVRIGDALSAGLVWVGYHAHLSPRGFIAANLVLSGLWLVIALSLGRSYFKRAQDKPEAKELA
jgi:AAA family ATP:ADP antiporter